MQSAELPQSRPNYRRRSGGRDTSELCSIPTAARVGEYIAAAVQSIAFNRPYAVVDGNVKRVLARLFLIDNPINQSASAKFFKRERICC